MTTDPLLNHNIRCQRELDREARLDADARFSTDTEGHALSRAIIQFVEKYVAWPQQLDASLALNEMIADRCKAILKAAVKIGATNATERGR